MYEVVVPAVFRKWTKSSSGASDFLSTEERAAEGAIGEG